MRIGLDTTRINIKDGEGRYANEVLRHLCLNYPEHEFVMFGPDTEKQHIYDNLEHIVFPEVDGLRARLGYGMRIAHHISKQKIDIFHNLCNYGYYRSPCPMVTTIFDFASVKYPKIRRRGFIYLYIYQHYLPSLLKKAAMLVAISNSAKEDLEELYGITENVVVTYLGYDKNLFNAEEQSDQTVLSKYNLPSDYLLFVGQITPKKNLGIILEAMAIMRSEGIDIKFVIAGKRGHGTAKLDQLITHYNLNEQVIELGYVPDPELASLYRQATIFVFPSVYEGFGLPIIESMACGTPIVASNAGSLPEVVENDKLTCDPHNAEEWSAKLKHLLQDEGFYKETIDWGFKQSKKFSWDACVSRLMDVYTSIPTQIV